MSWKIISRKRDFFVRFPIGLFVITILGLSPFIIGMVGAWLTELHTGEPCHEGNCYWGALPWLTFMTFPVAGLALMVYLGVATVNAVNYFSRKAGDN